MLANPACAVEVKGKPGTISSQGPFCLSDARAMWQVSPPQLSELELDARVCMVMLGNTRTLDSD